MKCIRIKNTVVLASVLAIFSVIPLSVFSSVFSYPLHGKLNFTINEELKHYISFSKEELDNFKLNKVSSITKINAFSNKSDTTEYLIAYDSLKVIIETFGSGYNLDQYRFTISYNLQNQITLIKYFYFNRASSYYLRYHYSFEKATYDSLGRYLSYHRDELQRRKWRLKNRIELEHLNRTEVYKDYYVLSYFDSKAVYNNSNVQIGSGSYDEEYPFMKKNLFITYSQNKDTAIYTYKSWSKSDSTYTIKAVKKYNDKGTLLEHYSKMNTKDSLFLYQKNIMNTQGKIIESIFRKPSDFSYYKNYTLEFKYNEKGLLKSEKRIEEDGSLSSQTAYTYEYY